MGGFVFYLLYGNIHEGSYGKELVFRLVFFGARYALIDLFFVCTLTERKITMESLGIGIYQCLV